GSRGSPRSPRRLRTGRRPGPSESDASSFVPACCRPCRHSRQRGVARTSAVFDMRTKRGGSSIGSRRVLIVEDWPLMAAASRDGLRLEAIAADIAGDGGTALELLSLNDYDIAVLDRDIPGPSGDAIAESIVASGSGMPILMLTAADRLDDKAAGF